MQGIKANGSSLATEVQSVLRAVQLDRQTHRRDDALPLPTMQSLSGQENSRSQLQINLPHQPLFRRTQMAKKNMTADEIETLEAEAYDVAERARRVTSAISKVKIDDIPDALGKARDLMAYSRDLLECAMSLLSRHDLQQLQAANDESGVALAKLRAKFKA
jgi:hypothetical protein